MTPPRRKSKRPSEAQRSVRILKKALARFEGLEDPHSVPAVEGEPEWVVRLAPFGRAFVRLLLREAGRRTRRKRRARSQ